MIILKLHFSRKKSLARWRRGNFHVNLNWRINFRKIGFCLFCAASFLLCARECVSTIILNDARWATDAEKLNHLFQSNLPLVSLDSCRRGGKLTESQFSICLRFEFFFSSTCVLDIRKHSSMLPLWDQFIIICYSFMFHLSHYMIHMRLVSSSSSVSASLVISSHANDLAFSLPTSNNHFTVNTLCWWIWRLFTFFLLLTLHPSHALIHIMMKRPRLSFHTMWNEDGWIIDFVRHTATVYHPGLWSIKIYGKSRLAHETKLDMLRWWENGEKLLNFLLWHWVEVQSWS